MKGKLKANPAVIQKLASQYKCMYCKHKFDEPLILPVKNVKPGKLQPNFSVKHLFHFEDTHGYPHDIVMEWVVAAVYEWKGNLTAKSQQRHS